MSFGRIDPFIQGVDALLSQMLGLTSEATSHGPTANIFISGVVCLLGDTTGQLAISFPRETAQALVGEMLGLDPSAVDSDMLQDGVGEIASIVASGAKAKLSEGHSVRFSLPSVVVGDQHRLTLYRGGPGQLVSFSTELGAFDLLVWFPSEG